MLIDDLTKWGIPERIVELWRKRQGETLLPVQSRALRKGLLGNHKNYDNGEENPVRMVISAPTSSGKSFCAEMAMARALVLRRKTVMLFPLKSLAEQMYRLFQKTYGSLGIRCLIVTGDHPENDRRFRQGDYRIAVAIYEKFDLLLTDSLDALKNIGLVVIDEIQTIAEPGRGAVLERLLTKILASIYSPSLIGLSAVIGDSECSAGRLAAWLKATLIEENMRPVELIRGVAAEGTFRYRSYNDSSDGRETFVKIDAGDDPFDGFVRQLKADGGSTLVFLKSRMDTVRQAFKLAAAVKWDAAGEAMEKLEGEETSFLVRSLSQVLGRGVAFHNSDLSPYQREVVEQAFIDKSVRVIFSTTTLAMGVNLPAETVYLETVKYTSGEYNGRPSLVPVSRAEFDNMTGRAGRLGKNGSENNNGQRKPGRAIVLAETDFDREILWENYIAGDNAEPLRSAFESMPLADWLLNMLVTSGSADAAGGFRYSFYSATGGRLDLADLETAMSLLVEHGLVREDDADNGYHPTPSGEAAARSGLSVKEAVYFMQKLKNDHPETGFGWTALALGSPDWNLPPGILTRFEQAHNVSLKTLYRLFDDKAAEARFLIGEEHHREPLSYRLAALLKALLLLDEWSRLVPVQKLEERYQMHLGQIISLGETAGHLAVALAVLVGARHVESPLLETLKGLAFSLRTGLPVSFEAWHRHFGDVLNRSDFAALEKNGLEKPEDLTSVSSEDLKRIIKGKYKFMLLNKKLESFKEEVYMERCFGVADNYPDMAGSVACIMPEMIEVDGSSEGERYLVRINGFPVRLTGKSFKYFVKLAWSRLNRDSGWIYKEDIEIGFNQARYLYRMKNEIGESLNFAWPIIENNRLGYYRLNADPSRIHINLDNLKKHPDYEVSSIVASQDIRPVN